MLSGAIAPHFVHELAFLGDYPKYRSPISCLPQGAEDGHYPVTVLVYGVCVEGGGRGGGATTEAKSVQEIGGSGTR